MEPRPKLKVELLLAILTVLVGLLLASSGVILFGVFLLLRSLLGIGLAGGMAHIGLVGDRRFPRPAVWEGTKVEGKVRLKISGRGSFVVHVAEAEELRQAAVGEGEFWAAVRGEGSWERRYELRPPRGVYREGPSTELFDLCFYFVKKPPLPEWDELVVLPRVERLPRVYLRPRRTLSTPGFIPSHRGGVGILFHGVRPSLPGERGVRLNWRALARYGEPMVNVYEEERATEVALVLDCRARVYRELGCPEALDHGVRAAASIACRLLEEGNRVGLLLYGEWPHWLPPRIGRAQRYRILGALAGARLGESEVFATLRELPLRFFPQGSSMIFVSPLVEEDAEYLELLVAKGFDVGTVVPDPLPMLRPKAKSESERLALELISLEREHLYRKLLDAGVWLAVWDPDDPLPAALEVQWGRFRR